MYPSDYRYTKQHEWIKVQGTSATVGITDYAQQELGDVVFVEMPKVGAKIAAGAVLWHRGIGKGGERNIHARFPARVTETNSSAGGHSGKNQHGPAQNGVADQDQARGPKSKSPSLMDAAA